MRPFFLWTVILLAGGACPSVAVADVLHISASTMGSYFTDTHGFMTVAGGSVSILQLVYSPEAVQSQDPAQPLTLGSLTLGQQKTYVNCSTQSSRGSCTDDYNPFAFQLLLSVGVPAAGGSVFHPTALIGGDVQGRITFNASAKTVSGHVDLLFPDAPTVFTFGDGRTNGSFKLLINSLRDVKPNQTVPLTASISDFNIVHVPEPAGVALLAIMLAAVSLGVKVAQRPG